MTKARTMILFIDPKTGGIYTFLRGKSCFGTNFSLTKDLSDYPHLRMPSMTASVS